ncbi:MAG: hypothetical protein ACKVYV_18110, partial [Limisphaerales bacterium]
MKPRPTDRSTGPCLPGRAAPAWCRRLAALAAFGLTVAAPSAPAADEPKEFDSLEPALGPGDSPESLPATLEADLPKEGTFDARWFERPLDWASGQTGALNEQTGLRLGVAYTMVFQQATEGDGDLYGGSGDLDLMASWTLVGRGTENTGRLVAGTEYRYRIGSQPASALFRSTGALLSHTGGFNDRYWAVRDVYWAQRLFDGQVRLLFGR